MAKRGRNLPKRRAKAAIATRRTYVSKTASTKNVAVPVEADIRRILPTQDWIAKIDPAQLTALADVQKLAVSHFYNGLVQLRKNFVGNLLFPPDQNQLARELHGTLMLPDGSPAARLAVSVQPVTDASNNVVQIPETALTDPRGQFALRNLPAVSVRSDSSVSLQFRGANGIEARQFPVSTIGSLGILGNISLRLALNPLPESIVASLEGLVGSLEQQLPTAPRPGTSGNPITLHFGDEGGCPLKFDCDLPEERFRYSMLVRLVEPRTSIVTESIWFRGDNNLLFPSALRNQAWVGLPGTQSQFVDRVPVDQPISVDGFRDRIVGNEDGVISDTETIPMAGTLGLGYTVQMAQQWTYMGLSLGDLVYSLPLAPGEQQRVAVFEQRQTLSTAELETLDYDEQQQARQQSDSSTLAVFNSAFAEHVRGSSSFSTQADSSSWGVAGGIGAVLGPVAIGIGAGGGGGSASSSGSSSNSLDGTRDYTSTVAGQAHNSVEREASARRHAQRTGMRLATASDTEQVTTKVITNNNRIHALTMQYWEVLRHFQVSTAIDGVTLVCFVPLEVVRFLPPGASLALVETEVATRPQVLFRYSQILKHADILRRWIPFDYRQGLNILEEFASNPRALPAFTSATEDIINLSISGTFLPIEDVYVTVLTRRGTRLGPVRMNGAIPQLPDTVTDAAHAFKSKTELVGELLRRRGADTGTDYKLSANITLPSSINPDDVVGFELSRDFRTLKYQLQPPPPTDPLQILLGAGNLAGNPFLSILGTRVDEAVNGVTMAPEELEQELGGPSVYDFSAGIVGPPKETYAQDYIGQAERFELPADGYPIAAQAVAPLLKFNQLLRIEQVLQHVVRNTITYSRAVWASLTPEERAIMLEGFTIGVPSGGIQDPTQNVPLLNCIANQVLGFYGNAMIMPFNIPAEVATQLSITGPDGAGNGTPAPRPFTTAEIQNALTQFHRAGFSPPVSNLVLPTRGVLGEAVLGSCPSAEKIDLTRFWNWQDSPLPQAADIAGTTLNKGSTLIGATAPSTLTGLPSIVTNVNAPPADANAALQALIAGQNTKDLPNITGLDQLAQLQGKTLDTAEKARADALARAQALASQGLTSAADIYKAKLQSDQQQKQQDQKTQQQNKQQVQQGVATMRSNATNYLAVANSKGDASSALSYAQQIVQQVFGTQGIPLDAASSLFATYGGGAATPTIGQTAFLTALGLV
jgi:hypothetical protein